ncbi:Protein SKG3 [Smittium mucronatum]|uniref:Protein SKG3 n=1 Tax=Smittium mucronatum TaxID=133383 RepID=A0A1R0H4P7_9FUNG|nr:Protein SKG3 [Smittium mucronatum]
MMSQVSARCYIQGILLKKHDLLVDGKPAKPRKWTTHYAELIGTTLFLYEVSTLFAEKLCTVLEVSPTSKTTNPVAKNLSEISEIITLIKGGKAINSTMLSINITFASFIAMGNIRNRSNNIEVLTVGQERYYLAASSKIRMDTWVDAFHSAISDFTFYSELLTQRLLISKYNYFENDELACDQFQVLVRFDTEPQWIPCDLKCRSHFSKKYELVLLNFPTKSKSKNKAPSIACFSLISKAFVFPAKDDHPKPENTPQKSPNSSGIVEELYSATSHLRFSGLIEYARHVKSKFVKTIANNISLSFKSEREMAHAISIASKLFPLPVFSSLGRNAVTNTVPFSNMTLTRDPNQFQPQDNRDLNCAKTQRSSDPAANQQGLKSPPSAQPLNSLKSPTANSHPEITDSNAVKQPLSDALLSGLNENSTTKSGFKAFNIKGLFGMLKKSSSANNVFKEEPNQPSIDQLVPQSPESPQEPLNLSSMPSEIQPVASFKEYSTDIPELDEFDVQKMIDKSVENLTSALPSSSAGPRSMDLKQPETDILDSDSETESEEPLTRVFQSHVANSSKMGMNFSEKDQVAPQTGITNIKRNNSDDQILVSLEASNNLLYQTSEYVQNVYNPYTDNSIGAFVSPNEKRIDNMHPFSEYNQNIEYNQQMENNQRFGYAPNPEYMQNPEYGQFQEHGQHPFSYNGYGQQATMMQMNAQPYPINPNEYEMNNMNYNNQNIYNNSTSPGNQNAGFCNMQDLPIGHNGFVDGGMQNAQLFQDNYFSQQQLHETNNAPLLSLKTAASGPDKHKGLIGAIATREQLRIDQKYRDSSSLIKGRQMKKPVDETTQQNRMSKMGFSDFNQDNGDSWGVGGNPYETPVANTRKVRNSNSVFFSDPAQKQPGIMHPFSVNNTATIGRPRTLMLSGSIPNFNSATISNRNTMVNNIHAYQNPYRDYAGDYDDDDVPLASSDLLSPNTNRNSSIFFKQTLDNSNQMIHHPFGSTPMKQSYSHQAQTVSNRKSVMFMANGRDGTLPRHHGMTNFNNGQYNDMLVQPIIEPQFPKMHAQNHMPDNRGFGGRDEHFHPGTNFSAEGSKSRSNMTLNMNNQTKQQRGIMALDVQNQDDSNTFSVERTKPAEALSSTLKSNQDSFTKLEFEYNCQVSQQAALQFEQFLDNCLESKPYSNTSSHDVYQSYTNFCSRNGIKQDLRVSYDIFVKMLASTDYSIRDNHNGGCTIFNAVVV